ncbi:hypothetical protein CERZMDRAFT_116383 [Cercospora zeae-maydis SCOH1-5]|uniref:Uncharacterized protein n=1 Tax=Cercospora zeae-maydis SCOH1-5 TaxID=717836 RepID=A0A6A6FSH1_9PEZI|nr:hypothetical protein CERZMDRAFT_116383 [Cercospora zeae-maydis SCOH1-5]
MQICSLRHAYDSLSFHSSDHSHHRRVGGGIVAAASSWASGMRATGPPPLITVTAGEAPSACVNHTGCRPNDEQAAQEQLQVRLRRNGAAPPHGIHVKRDHGSSVAVTIGLQGHARYSRHAIDALLTPDSLQEANRQLSPLLRLPGDVLERIVKHSVSYSHDVVTEAKEPGLLRTCHALRSMASKAYFSQNTFKRKRRLSEDNLEQWAKVRVGENRRFVRKVRIGPPTHCNNEDAQQEASMVEKAYGLTPGSVWCLSEDDYENDYTWWVNSRGETEICEEKTSDEDQRSPDCFEAVESSAKPAASWYCTSWAQGHHATDYFSLRRAPPTPESRPSASDLR